MNAPASRPRGRPRVLSQEAEAIFRNMLPDITTRRGLQNRMYSGRAANILNKIDGAKVSARFEWLVGHPSGRPKPKSTVLTELGRLDKPDDIVAFADILCEKKYPARTAVALLRQRVRKTAVTQPTAAAVTKYLVGAVEAWFQQYPEADSHVMLEALNETYSIIQSCIERAAR